jgi:hypothetical protein
MIAVPQPRPKAAARHGAARREFIRPGTTPRGIVHWTQGDNQRQCSDPAMAQELDGRN